MAWMFAATEQDMGVGMHMHYHLPPPVLAPPTPFPSHAAMTFFDDKLATKTKVDNRKAARTGTKAKFLLLPHLPWIGPLSTGMPKDNTGAQQILMGVGIGVHPFGGLGFVTIEGKPAAGMLSTCLGCYGVAPGFDMMLPFVGLDFVMIPTRLPTVFYGPAPLALDLFVLILALVEALFDWIASKLPDGFAKDLLDIFKKSVLEGLEASFTAYESGVRPISACMQAGVRAFTYAFIDNMIDYAVGKAVDAVAGVVGGAFGSVTDGLLAKTGTTWASGALSVVGGGLMEGAKTLATDYVKGAAGGVVNDMTGGDYQNYLDERSKQQNAAKSDLENPVLGPVAGVIEKASAVANKTANKKGSEVGLNTSAGASTIGQAVAEDFVSGKLQDAAAPVLTSALESAGASPEVAKAFGKGLAKSGSGAATKKAAGALKAKEDSPTDDAGDANAETTATEPAQQELFPDQAPKQDSTTTSTTTTTPTQSTEDTGNDLPPQGEQLNLF